MFMKYTDVSELNFYIYIYTIIYTYQTTRCSIFKCNGNVFHVQQISFMYSDRSAPYFDISLYTSAEQNAFYLELNNSNNSTRKVMCNSVYRVFC